jgi:hypothetical protein
MYVCMHACMHVCLYVCMYVCKFVCLFVCLFDWLIDCLFVCMYVLFVCLFVCMYVCMHGGDFVIEKHPTRVIIRHCRCAYALMYVCVFMHVCLLCFVVSCHVMVWYNFMVMFFHVCMYVCFYVCMYVCVCICTYICPYVLLCVYVVQLHADRPKRGHTPATICHYYFPLFSL